MRFGRVFGVMICGFLALFSLDAKDSPSTKRLENRIQNLKSEVRDLRLSVRSLQTVQNRLKDELERGEWAFRDRFSEVVIPLLQWPERHLWTKVRRWIELYHTEVVISEFRNRLVKEPLELVSERELRINQTFDLKEEMESALKKLESKQSLLNLQLQELKSLNRKR